MRRDVFLLRPGSRDFGGAGGAGLLLYTCSFVASRRWISYVAT